MARSAFTVALKAEQPDSDGRQWVHLLPEGTFDARDGRGPWKLANAEAVIAATQKWAGRVQLVVDYEHQTLRMANNGHPAPAAGWIVALSARDTGIWGLVEWTVRAQAALASREYRYISPVFRHDPTNGEVRSIVNAALTNTPAADALTPVALNVEDYEEVKMEEQLAELRRLLKLDDKADLAAIVAKVEELATQSQAALSAATPDPAKFVPIGDFQRVIAEANTLRQGITKTAAEGLVAAHVQAGRLMPFLKDWAVGLCTVNKPAFDQFMEGVGPAFSHMFTPQERHWKQPEARAKKLADQEGAVCSALGLTEEEFINARGNADA